MLCLSDHNYKFKILLISLLSAILFAFSACTMQEDELAVSPGFDGAVEDGIILRYVPEVAEIRIETIMPLVRTEEFETLQTIASGFHFPQEERLTFQRTGGYVDLRVSQGNFVRQGDLLAVLSHEEDSVQVNRRLAEIRLDQFERSMAETTLSLQMNIERARENFIFAGADGDWEEWALRLQLAEIEYEIFRTNSRVQHTALLDALADINVLLTGEELFAPFDGVVMRTISNGTFISGRSQIITLLDVDNFFFVIPDTNGSFNIRFGDIIRLETPHARVIREEGGESEPLLSIYAQVVSEPWATGAAGRVGYMLLPLNRQEFFDTVEGITLAQAFALRVYAQITRNFVPDALSLPSRAVYSAGTRHFVRVYNNGTPSRRYVQIGATTGPRGYTQIISGIDKDTQVVVLR